MTTDVNAGAGVPQAPLLERIISGSIRFRWSVTWGRPQAGSGRRASQASAGHSARLACGEAGGRAVGGPRAAHSARSLS